MRCKIGAQHHRHECPPLGSQSSRYSQGPPELGLAIPGEARTRGAPGLDRGHRRVRLVCPATGGGAPGSTRSLNGGGGQACSGLRASQGVSLSGRREDRRHMGLVPAAFGHFCTLHDDLLLPPLSRACRTALVTSQGQPGVCPPLPCVPCTGEPARAAGKPFPRRQLWPVL